MSLPAGVYGVLMFFVALAFGFLIRGRGRGSADEVPVPVGSERAAARHATATDATGTAPPER